MWENFCNIRTRVGDVSTINMPKICGSDLISIPKITGRKLKSSYLYRCILRAWGFFSFLSDAFSKATRQAGVYIYIHFNYQREMSVHLNTWGSLSQRMGKAYKIFPIKLDKERELLSNLTRC